MKFSARNKKLRRALADLSESKKRYGADMAKKIMSRLNAFKAATSLADFWPPKSGPERCHELKGDLAGIFSVDLKQPYRLLFRPVEDDPPEDGADEHERWKSITAIEFLAIEDTHG